MAHLTDNFTSEAPLSPAVRQAIATALDEGWADPKKLGSAAARAASLRGAAIEEIAAAWRLSPGSLEVVGEPHLLAYMSLAGFLHSARPLVTSTIDIGKIRAVARSHPEGSKVLPVDSSGVINQGEIPEAAVISLQATNGETGISQDIRRWSHLKSQVVLDATHSLPEYDDYQDFLAVSLDARSWNGPAGIGLLAINQPEKFIYPLPHIAPIRVPGSYSLPLLIGSAIALSETLNERAHCYDLRNQLHTHLSAIGGVTVIGGNNDSRYLSALVADVSGEELLRGLNKRDVSIDVGSACSPEDLAPSHIIAAMGYPTEGHIRFTIHPHHNSHDIERLLQIIKEELALLNR